MADPFTLAGVGMAASAGGGILSALGQGEKGEADSRMYAYKAGIARMNAKIQRQNSDYALTAGDLNAERSGLTTGFTIAKQKVAQAANGFDVNSGTNAEVRDSTRAMGVVDQTTIRTNAGRQALGFRNQAAGLDVEASADMMASENAKSAGILGMVGTLIGTAGSVASKWYQSGQVFGPSTNPYYGPLNYNDNRG